LIKHYETIIWDWNGTLLDDVGLAISVMNRMLEQHGYPQIDRHQYTNIFDFPVRGYYQRAGFDLGEHDFESLSTTFCDAFEVDLHKASLFRDTRATVTGLSGFRQFVLSNTEHDALIRMLGICELNNAFEGIYGLQHNQATGKLNIGHRLLSLNNIDPQQVLLVGDTTHDAEVAKALGANCLLVSTGHNSRTRLEATGYEVVDSLRQVSQFLS
jgi:phosphoglycolate phosphatase